MHGQLRDYPQVGLLCLEDTPQPPRDILVSTEPAQGSKPTGVSNLLPLLNIQRWQEFWTLDLSTLLGRPGLVQAPG